MPTNLAIDDSLLEEARKVGGHRTKRETVPPPSKNTSSDESSRKSFRCSEASTTRPVTITNASERRNVREYPGRHLRLVPGTSAKD